MCAPGRRMSLVDRPRATPAGLDPASGWRSPDPTEDCPRSLARPPARRAALIRDYPPSVPHCRTGSAADAVVVYEAPLAPSPTRAAENWEHKFSRHP